MKNFKKILTFTNLLFIAATVVYILNIFVISPDTGSMSLSMTEILKNNNVPFDLTILFKLFGLWGGHLNDLLGFNLNDVFSGEVWRIYTVVLTHAHLPHFAMNMVALIFAGNNIEKKYGTLKTIGLFLGLTAANGFVTDFILVYLFGNDVSTSTGASGWITALMGMILAKCIFDKSYFKTGIKKGYSIYLIIYFVSTTFILSPNVFTITCHLSGIILGFITEFIIHKCINKKCIKAE